MNFTYEFPDITGYIQKSGTYKKPRRISGLRLGESRTAVEKRFPLSLSRRDEDKDIDYFTVSMKEKISLFDEEVASLGCSFVKGEAALLFADFIFSTEEMRNRLTSLFGEPAKVNDVFLWTDAATSIFLMANENSASLILADTALEQSSWQIPLKWKMPGSEKHYGRNTEIPWAASDKKHILPALFLWESRQQLCLPVHGYTPNYLQAMRTFSSYLSWYSAHWVSCRSLVWRYAAFRISVFLIYTTGDSSAFFL